MNGNTVLHGFRLVRYFRYPYNTLLCLKGKGMKFFTSEWGSSGCEDDSVFDKYQEYLSSVSSKLPKQLLLIQQNFTLHDANVG
jgi:hypothetical protein